MKSLLESITTVNESKFNGIIGNIKDLFCYDNLSNTQKDIVADLFGDGIDSIIYKIVKFRDNTEYNSPAYEEFNESVNMCKEIYRALKP